MDRKNISEIIKNNESLTKAKDDAKAIFSLAKKGAVSSVNSGASAVKKVVAKTKKTEEKETEDKESLKKKLNSQKSEIEKKGFSDSAMNVAMETITKLSTLPVVRVDREEFLRKAFGSSQYIDVILAEGPQAVFTVESLRKKADDIIKNSTRKTSAASFAAGLPSNIAVMIAAGSADVVQYFAFALNLAQKIAYLFGEDNIFMDQEDLVDKNGEALSEDVQVKIIGYLGAMMGVSGAGALILKTSRQAGQVIGKKVAAQALTKTTWYPIFKKVGSVLGYKITKKTVESIINKAVPVIGGVISGGLTYVTFKPMGGRLADEFVKIINGDYKSELDLNPEFLKRLQGTEAELAKDLAEPADGQDIIDADYTEIADEEKQPLE